MHDLSHTDGILGLSTYAHFTAPTFGIGNRKLTRGERGALPHRYVPPKGDASLALRSRTRYIIQAVI